MKLLILQTCDGVFYKGFLDATETLHRDYALKHGYAYLRYDGIINGSQPWHSAFNRIYLLQEEFDKGESDWALLLDADAVITDVSMPLDDFLDNNVAIVACRGGTDDENVHWDINNGVVLFNLRHPKLPEIINQWKLIYEDAIKAGDMSKQIDWDSSDEETNDQDMLHKVLKSIDASCVKVYRGEKHNALNYEGPFIQQRLRSTNTSRSDRIHWIRQRVADVSKLAASSCDLNRSK